MLVLSKNYGDILSIKASKIKQLQRFTEQNQPVDRFISPEFV
ncbi:hypothetical protein [Nostoc sp.]